MFLAQQQMHESETKQNGHQYWLVLSIAHEKQT
jgi:hypothetical protein